MDRQEIKNINTRINGIKKGAEELRDLYRGIPAVERNAARILASVKMLEINVSDLLLVK